MADPPPGCEDVAAEPLRTEGRNEEGSEKFAADDSMEEMGETSGGEDDESYEPEDDSDDLLYSSEDDSDDMLDSSEDDASNQMEVKVPDSELSTLQSEIAEEERRALGGWTEESAEAFRQELKEDWILRNSQVQKQTQPGNNSGRNSAAATAGETQSRSSVLTAEAAGSDPARVGMGMHLVKSASKYSLPACMACPDFPGKKSDHTDIGEAADVERTRAGDDVLNLPTMASGCSLQADMAGTVFMAANMEGTDKLSTANHGDMVGPDIMEFQLADTEIGRSSVLAHAEGALPAQPIAAFSVEEACMLDLYAAQPLHDHPSPEPAVPVAQLTATDHSTHFPPSTGEAHPVSTDLAQPSNHVPTSLPDPSRPAADAIPAQLTQPTKKPSWQPPAKAPEIQPTNPQTQPNT